MPKSFREGSDPHTIRLGTGGRVGLPTAIKIWNGGTRNTCSTRCRRRSGTTSTAASKANTNTVSMNMFCVATVTVTTILLVSSPGVVTAFSISPFGPKPASCFASSSSSPSSSSHSNYFGKQQPRSPSYSYSSSSPLFLYAPPGSGYARPEDEVSALPETYDPMMEYPGTMRPGRTPENVPFQDLPIGDDDDEHPIPWPHFQEIEWHHRWEPPHEHPIPMEEFIELQGRWATPEMEAAMRSGVRQNVRERRELAEAEKRETIITDDMDDDFDAGGDEPVELGDGIYGRLGSATEQALTAAITAPRPKGQEKKSAFDDDDDDIEDEDYDEDLDDFLLDLGLDFADDNDDAKGKVDKKKMGDKAKATAPKRSIISDVEIEDDDGNDDDLDYEADETMDATTTINVEDDDDVDLDLEDEDDLGDGVDTVPLEDFGDNDSLDTEDIFDEGGFDFGDGDFDIDGGDMW